jgi:glucan-binding YG repeat protein
MSKKTFQEMSMKTLQEVPKNISKKTFQEMSMKTLQEVPKNISKKTFQEMSMKTLQEVPKKMANNGYIQTTPHWQFEFEHGETRTQVFTLPGGSWVYVNHDSAAERLHSIRPEDQQHPFAEYHTMREALIALGWNDQKIRYWNYVPPSVQWDWEDVTEDEFLDNPIHYTPAPIIRVL